MAKPDKARNLPALIVLEKGARTGRGVRSSPTSGRGPSGWRTGPGRGIPKIASRTPPGRLPSRGRRRRGPVPSPAGRTRPRPSPSGSCWRTASSKARELRRHARDVLGAHRGHHQGQGLEVAPHAHNDAQGQRPLRDARPRACPPCGRGERDTRLDGVDVRGEGHRCGGRGGEGGEEEQREEVVRRPADVLRLRGDDYGHIRALGMHMETAQRVTTRNPRFGAGLRARRTRRPASATAGRVPEVPFRPDAVHAPDRGA